MSREEQRRAVRELRESLIAQLEELYGNAFEKLASQNLGEGGIARLTQLLLRSRDQLRHTPRPHTCTPPRPPT